jgi:centromeric protein E
MEPPPDDFVKVFLRIRPLNEREQSDDSVEIPWQFNRTQIKIRSNTTALRTTSFDRILSPETNQQMCYDQVAKSLVTNSMEGFNGTIFAYGQTGSGKTWSMSGVPELGNSSAGIMVRALETVFQYIAAHPEREFFLRMAYMEVYNEEINDLLGGSAAAQSGMKDDLSWKNLKIKRNDPVKGAVIDNLTEIVVTSAEQALAAVIDGESIRHVAGTEMNARSSRSHLMFRLAIESSRGVGHETIKTTTAEVDDDTFRDLKATDSKEQHVRVSYLNLVDLAGSERQQNAQTTGKRLKEGASINKSLLNLGKVISKLSGGSGGGGGNSGGGNSGGGGGGNSGGGGGGEQDVSASEAAASSPPTSPKNRSPKNRSKLSKGLSRTRSSAHAAAKLLLRKKNKTTMGKVHIPFRNSKLTRILQSSLGGNASTAVLLTMTASPQYQNESLSSIKFGELCKKIKNKVKKNVDKTQSMLDQYRAEINSLREELVRKEKEQQ